MQKNMQFTSMQGLYFAYICKYAQGTLLMTVTSRDSDRQSQLVSCIGNRNFRVTVPTVDSP